MREFMKRIGLLAAVVAVLGLLLGTVHAEAAVKWAFSTSNGQKKANVNKSMAMEKGEYQDMNLYRNGKQIKEKDATYSVKWYSSDKNVVYIDKASGKMKADKYGKMKKDTGSAKITAVITNKKTGTTAKKSFTVKVKGTPVPTATPTPSPAPARPETPASAFQHSIGADGNVMIEYLIDETLSEVVVPREIEGRPVTSIWRMTENNVTLTSVVIPDTVTNIGEGAFMACLNLKNIEMPDSVTHIGSHAFHYTAWLSEQQKQSDEVLIGDGILYSVSDELEGEYVMSSGIKRIADGALSYHDNLTSVVIADGVVSIGNKAFYGCTNLTSVKIPDSVTSIGEGAFDSSGLTSVEVPESVTDIGAGAFHNTPWFMERWYGESGAAILGDGVLYYVFGEPEGEYVIPQGVKRIAGNAFDGCYKVTSIKVPDSVKYIGDRAFVGCCDLKNIEIPDSVEYMGYTVFYFMTDWDSPNSMSIITPAGSYVEQWANYQGCADKLVLK